MLPDILTAAKNLVVAVNNASQTYLTVNGTTNAANIGSATLVKLGAGRVCTLSVIAGGSGVGAIYDATSASSTSNQIYTIPTTVGTYLVNIPTLYGLVVAPGSGQLVAVSFS